MFFLLLYMLLSLIVLTPLVGALIMLPLNEATTKDIERVKIISLIISLVTFGLTVLVWVLYDSGSVGFQLVMYADAGFAHIHLGVDALSVYYVVLTGFLTPICILASWSNVTKNIKLFIITQLIIESVLLALFVVLDLLLFYVAFETVLIPLFFLIGLYGGSPSRVRSALLLFLYTLAGSLFILLSILVLYAHVGTTDISVLSAIDIDPSIQRILWLGFFVALAVKTPIVPFHMWLPRAHADAPLAGSIVLAGTVLKMATYGFLRVLLPILPDASAYYTPLVQTIAVISLVYSSLATIRQVDIKSLVAYSSVGHMAIVILGLFSNTQVGIEGAIILSLAHGFVSPAIFILVGGVLYDRFHTRAIRYYRGLAQIMPVFTVLFFFATSANMGVPLSLNWAGEFIALAGTFQASPVAGSLGALGIVFSACYSIWLWGRLVAGKYSSHLTYTIDITRREVVIIITLIVPTIILGIMPSVILDGLHVAVSNLLYVLFIFSYYNIYTFIMQMSYELL